MKIDILTLFPETLLWVNQSLTNLKAGKGIT